MTVDERFANTREELQQRVTHGTRVEATIGPVEDFATDFDHTDERWAADMYAVLDDLRGTVAHTDRYGGGWLPTTYADVAEVAYDTDRFSSRSVIMSNFRTDPAIAPVGGTPPITSDPPFHHGARKLLLPAFTKGAAARIEPRVRSYCHELLDGLDGDFDAAADYAAHIPVRAISELLGFPPGDGPRFAAFISEMLEGLNVPPAERLGTMQRLFAYLMEQIDDHLARPREDLTTFLLQAEIGGERLDPFHVAGTMGLLLVAGIDTTWSAIGAGVWHLASHPDDLARLAADPALMPTAVEELLRAYSPVTMARLARADTELGGCPVRREDWVLLSFPAANRDPAQFDRADEVLLDREVNRHAAFGLGIHRCLGSHLARMELRTALEVLLERHPRFALADPGAVRWSKGQVRGPRVLPLTIG